MGLFYPLNMNGDHQKWAQKQGCLMCLGVGLIPLAQIQSHGSSCKGGWEM
jgi:hypothetical protein